MSKSTRASVLVACAVACARAPEPGAGSRAERGGASAASSAAPGATSAAPGPAGEPIKIDVQTTAMGTHVEVVAYAANVGDEARTRAAIAEAVERMRALEAVLTDWKAESDVGRINAQPGRAVTVSSSTEECVTRGLWIGEQSQGAFDLTFQTMKALWRFGDAAEANPAPPSAAAVAAARRDVDYRQVRVDHQAHTVQIGARQQLGLGGIAKGYIVDRGAALLQERGVQSFLLQAGGDLYGRGKKPDGSPWVSGIRDPRGDGFFAVIELEDHAFSTAGDYARSYVHGGKRYHHIIDPHTGWPATASRSVTVWAPDAFTADAVDDAVFILGPERGLKLAESVAGVGVVIVDAQNRVHVSPRLTGKIKILRDPTAGL